MRNLFIAFADSTQMYLNRLSAVEIVAQSDSEFFEGLFLAAMFVTIFFGPTIVAFNRSHHYRWPIFAMNIAGFNGFAWIAALVWAVWPRKTTIIDTIVQPLVDQNQSPRIYPSDKRKEK